MSYHRKSSKSATATSCHEQNPQNTAMVNSGAAPNTSAAGARETRLRMMVSAAEGARTWKRRVTSVYEQARRKPPQRTLMKVKTWSPPPGVPQVVRRVRAWQKAQTANDKKNHPCFPVAFPVPEQRDGKARAARAARQGIQPKESQPTIKTMSTNRPVRKGNSRTTQPAHPTSAKRVRHSSALIGMAAPTGAHALCLHPTHQKWRPPSSRKVRPTANSTAATAMVRHGSRFRPPGKVAAASADAGAAKCSVPLKRRPSTTYWSADGASSSRVWGRARGIRAKRERDVQ